MTLCRVAASTNGCRQNADPLIVYGEFILSPVTSSNIDATAVDARPTSAPPPPASGPAIHRTPLLASRSLSERIGVEVRLKCENLQRAGSFKIRGAMNALLQLD